MFKLLLTFNVRCLLPIKAVVKDSLKCLQELKVFSQHQVIWVNKCTCFSKNKLHSFHIPPPCSLIMCISGLLITDATFLQHIDCEERRQQSWNSSLLFSLYQSLIYLGQDNPHSSYELAISVKLTESRAQVVEWGWENGPRLSNTKA